MRLSVKHKKTMKKLLLLLLFLPFTNYSQHNFTVKNNQLVWQKVYENPVKKNTFFTQLANIKETNLLENTAIGISGTTDWYVFKIQKPPYWASFPISYFVNIEFKENKYRVTISNVAFDGPEIITYGVKQKMDYKLNLGALDNGKLIQKKKVLSTLNQLNTHFTEKYTAKEITEDW